jgi:hypothetical protein
MKSNLRGILGIVSLTLAALACQTITGGGVRNTPTPIVVIDTLPPVFPTATQSSTVLLSDDFSSIRWGTDTNADRSIEYANESLQMIVSTTNYFVWSTPNDQDYQDIHMEVTVRNNNTDSTTAFGLMCNQQPGDNSSFYYFLIRPAGEYVIARSATGQDDLFLTNTDSWGSSDLISRNASSYRVGADCGHGALTLYVDGQQIASVSDSTYTSGGVGVITWSGENANSTNVSFDDFLMTELP